MVRELLKKAKVEQNIAHPGSHDAQQGINYIVNSHSVFLIYLTIINNDLYIISLIISYTPPGV